MRLESARAADRQAVRACTSKALTDANALDFDDLLLKTVELFEKSEQVRERYSEKFRYLMVDEYQDTNRPQYLLIQRLAARHRNLCVVGDPDQSIYKWRGADLRNILDFEHDFPEAKIVSSSATTARRRSSSTRRRRSSRRTATARRSGSTPTAPAARRCCTTALATTSTRPSSSRATRRDALHDDVENTVAVLYRTNAQSRTIEDALRRSGTDYKIIGGVRFYERKEIKDSLAYLQAAC